MKLNLFSSPQKSALPRCAHLSPAGRQCTQPVCSSDPDYCFTHKPKLPPTPSPESLLAADLTQAAGSLNSPEDVNRVLTKIFLALIEDRISVKKAGILTYLAQNILRAQREIAFHQKLKADALRREEEAESNKSCMGTYEIPRPKRDGPRYGLGEVDEAPNHAPTDRPINDPVIDRVNHPVNKISHSVLETPSPGHAIPPVLAVASVAATNLTSQTSPMLDLPNFQTSGAANPACSPPQTESPPEFLSFTRTFPHRSRHRAWAW
jgi:hypothetical protein